MVDQCFVCLWTHTGEEKIHLSMDVNLSPKQGIRTGGILRPGDEGQIRVTVLTRRELMSQIPGIYDPLRLLYPITIKFKLVLQKIVEAELGWDKPLKGKLKSAAKSALIKIVRSGSISFPRCALGVLRKARVDVHGIWGWREACISLLPLCPQTTQESRP